MACLSVVTSPFTILPSSASRVSLLAPLLVPELAPYCLLILPNHRTSPQLSPVVVLDSLPVGHEHLGSIQLLVRLYFYGYQCQPTNPVVFSML